MNIYMWSLNVYKARYQASKDSCLSIEVMTFSYPNYYFINILQIYLCITMFWKILY